jgi:hypothetical protein
MARVDSSSTTADIRGRIGSLVLSSNAQGNYAKVFVPPSLRRTPAQQEQRRLFALASQTWLTLSSAVQDDWNDCAATAGYQRYDWWGNAYYLTGQQLYISTFLLLNRVGAGAPSGPPLSAVPAAPPTLSVHWYWSPDTHQSTIELTTSFPASVDYALVDFSYRIPPGSSSPASPFVPLTLFVNPDNGPFDLHGLLDPLVGYSPLAARMFLQVYSMTHDGRLSLPVAYTATATIHI